MDMRSKDNLQHEGKPKAVRSSINKSSHQVKVLTLGMKVPYIKNHQGHQPQSGTSKSSSTLARIPKMSSIIEGVLDAFKLIKY